MLLSFVVAALVSPADDLVIKNALVWTDGQRTQDACVAVKDGRVTYLGKNDAGRIAKAAKVVDAKGTVVLPGFIDSHTHLLDGGVELTQLDLRDANTKSEFVRRVGAWAQKTEKGKWLIGNSWSAESWPEKVQPVKEDIDPVTKDVPTILVRMDGHSLIANSAALKLARITRDTKNPGGGSIDRDPKTGEPTGVLRETAMALIYFVVPRSTNEETYQGLRAAAKMANQCGVTAVSEIGSTSGWHHYLRFAKEPAPSLRFALYCTTVDWTSQIKQIQEFTPMDGWVVPKGIKAYMDGSLGSRTAWMLEPFTKMLPDQASPTGLPRTGFTDGSYRKGIKEAAAAGLQVIVHAIGDRANREILDLFESAVPNLKQLRFRVEHAQHLTAADIPRFGKLGVIPSMQPYHKADDGRYCEEVIGTDRSKTSYAYKDLLDTGAQLTFGSDWSVVSINPWLGIETAVTGKIMTGKVWMPHENIPLDQALLCYTSRGAYAMRMESEIGSLKVGHRADIQILNKSPFAKNPEYRSIKPARLFIEGREVKLGG
ncbi:MAG: amidohydrolase [Armatimonadetes bacterium]|nr:amidohydrolase [Armatimonadota bacterium]